MQTPAFLETLNKKRFGLVKNPFDRSGRHRRCVVLLSFFLDDKPKKKLDILKCSGILKKDNANVGSYYSNFFATFSQTNIIRYNTAIASWERSENYLPYLVYTVKCMLETANKDKLLALLSTKQQELIETDLTSVVLEMSQDNLIVSTLKTIWRGTENTVMDFILNSD